MASEAAVQLGYGGRHLRFGAKSHAQGFRRQRGRQHDAAARRTNREQQRRLARDLICVRRVVNRAQPPGCCAQSQHGRNHADKTP